MGEFIKHHNSEDEWSYVFDVYWGTCNLTLGAVPELLAQQAFARAERIIIEQPFTTFTSEELEGVLTDAVNWVIRYNRDQPKDAKAYRIVRNLRILRGSTREQAEWPWWTDDDWEMYDGVKASTQECPTGSDASGADATHVGG